MVRFSEGKFSLADANLGHYSSESLPHIKMALRAVCQNDSSDFDLSPFFAAAGSESIEEVKRFVEIGVIYFLAGCLGGAKEAIKARLPEFGSNPEDFIAVNCAVPVADAEEDDVCKVFDEALRKAWMLSDLLANHPEVDLSTLESFVGDVEGAADHEECREACHVYPETSANVQGFIRSQSSSTGLYLFSDVGAGTVDQSVFLFSRHKNQERLAYLFSDVSPLGSSQIEILAAKSLNKTDWKTLERLRQEKESNSGIRPLRSARNTIADRLKKATTRILAGSKEKLIRRGQMENTRLLFGGGGECEDPYRLAVRQPFTGPLFHDPISPDELGLPRPRDLELNQVQSRWFPRLTVAYGLSFQRADLADFKFPREMSKTQKSELWRPIKLNKLRVVRGGFVESE